ncbi:excisionase family DNA-binding protein [Rubrivivax gelatinosus]|uniref:excisionase family DNA-binding protein n=1 Tax=Rubrivivax gelatinosus TaxID=28068 RepID=UPI0005C1D7D4|nr:excisionase family DNA-binding protein [Rubrivivax gelatinosus]MBG6083111.1 excisionase family DNA binding protein [Rubrivivax gelatinosus]
MGTKTTSKAQSYSTAAVAKRLGVSIPTVQRWVDQGHLKAWRTMGGHRRISAESAEHMFSSQELPEECDSPEEDARPLTVVLVDDNAEDLHLLQVLVSSVLPGAEVHATQNGFVGLYTIGQHRADVVIANIAVPNMDGLEMIRNLFEHPGMKPAALIAVSSLAAAEVGRLPPGIPLLAKPPALADVVIALKAQLGDDLVAAPDGLG